MSHQPLSLKEKLGYGLGDTASNIVYQAVGNLLLYFYTDVYGIEAAAAGTLLLVVRVLDAFLDPMMGAVADRTRTRHGRYRPWMLWVAVPYGLLAIAVFFTPNADVGTKLVYAYISYALMMAAYTAVNIPYSALGGVITADPQERANVQTYRFAMAMLGGALVTASVLPLVNLLGNGDRELGYTLAMTVMALVAVLCFFGCFALTQERVPINETTAKHSIWSDVLAMLANRQWQIIALATLFIMTRGAMQSAVKPYFVDYYLIKDNIPAFFASTDTLISTFLTLTMLAGVGGALTAGVLVKKLCKVTVMRIAVTGTLTINLLLFLLPRDAVLLSLCLIMMANFCHMIFVPMLFSTVPDTVDFGLKTYGKGAMGMFVAGHLLALKIGNAFGQAATGWLLTMTGYVPKAVQTEEALNGILFIYAGSSVVAAVLVLLCLQFYKFTKGWELRA